MLVLTRKRGQSLMIGQDVEISVIEISGDQVRLGINAPKSVTIHRKEVFDDICQENKAAAHVSFNSQELRKAMENLYPLKRSKEESGPD